MSAKVTLELPRVAQSLDFTCGAACFESMYRYLNVSSGSSQRGELYSEMRFARELGTIDLGYTDPERVHALAMSYNFISLFIREAQMEDIQSAINQGRVVFVTWWDVDAGHYSLVKFMDEHHVVLMDPWAARKNEDTLLSRMDFETFWSARGRVMIAVSK